MSALVHYSILALEAIFFAGMAGSLIVAIAAFVGDLHVFMEKDKVAEADIRSPRIKPRQ